MKICQLHHTLVRLYNKPSPPCDEQLVSGLGMRLQTETKSDNKLPTSKWFALISFPGHLNPNNVAQKEG